jgi:hypothetical protein
MIQLSYGDIKKEYKNYYISLLQKNNYVEISKEEAHKITSGFVLEENKIFLVVRAVHPKKDNHYRITINEKNEVYIFNGQMGSVGFKIHKDAIVLAVEKIPQNIYVTFAVVK